MKKRRFRPGRRLAVFLAAVAVVLSGYGAYQGIGTIRNRQYAEQTRHMSAEQVVQFYFTAWQHRNGRAMRAVTLDGTPGMENEFVMWLSSLTFSVSEEVPATETYLRGRRDYKEYADLKVYGVIFTANYPGFIESGFSPGQYWDYVVVKEKPDSPWKISGAGFI